MTTPTELTVTADQRRAALEALGLDPDLTVSVSLGADWVTALVISTDDNGHVLVDGGVTVTHNATGPITRPDPA